MNKFIQYFEGIRKRTIKYVLAIPPGQLAWSLSEGEFTCGEIVRHILAIELMTIGMVSDDAVSYAGHMAKEGITLEMLVGELGSRHFKAINILETLPDTILMEKREAIDGRPVHSWRLLMAMVEHEIHHRSQLGVYLSLMGVEPPQLYGIGVDEVIAAAGGDKRETTFGTKVNQHG
ncbi:DinB family protein [Chloroflexota bacterium]